MKLWIPNICPQQVHNNLEEEVYGDGWLKFIYNNPLGRICLWALVKRLWFSKWYGWRMNLNGSRSKIIPFIDNFSLDTNEFKHPVSSFKNFNEFFFRKLKPSSRPIVQDPDLVIFPADGRHLGFQNVDSRKRFCKRTKVQSGKTILTVS